MADTNLAEVHPLPGREWCAKAALGDAMQRAQDNAPLIVLWIGEDGKVRHSSSAKRQEVVWMCQFAIYDTMYGE